MSTIELDDKKENKENKEIISNNNIVKIKKKIKKNRCNFEGCKKKLSIIDKTIVCKCNKVFCAKHRISVNHNCEIDIKKDNLKEKYGLGGGQFNKLIKI